MYIDKSLKEYVYQVSSKSSMPGGGSALALVSSLGAALTNMVMNLTRYKVEFDKLDDKIKDEMINKYSDLNKYIERLNEIVDEDTTAFNGVLEAYKLAKETKEEKLYRENKIQEGYKKALEIPLECMKISLNILKNQKIFAQYGNKGLITDVGIGVILAYSAMEGSQLNVIVNLKSIKDPSYIENINNDMERILKEGKNYKEEIMDIVYKELNK